jgi:hypothetical protein
MAAAASTAARNWVVSRAAAATFVAVAAAARAAAAAFAAAATLAAAALSRSRSRPGEVRILVSRAAALQVCAENPELGPILPMLQALHAEGSPLFYVDGTRANDIVEGAKQGSPASAHLRAIALQPILRKYDAKMQKHGGWVRGIADDLYLEEGASPERMERHDAGTHRQRQIGGDATSDTSRSTQFK